MRLIDPTKTRIRYEDTEYGPRRIAYRDHFNGSRDAKIRLTGLRLNMTAGAPPNKEHVAAIHNLEAAQAEWMLAKHSNDEQWRIAARQRLIDANERLWEVQGET